MITKFLDVGGVFGALFDPSTAEELRDIGGRLPPSAGGNPFLFALDLFSLMFICLVASATIIRLWSRTVSEGLPCAHPVFLHRSMIVGLLTTLLFGFMPNTLVSLAWREVPPETLGVLLLIDKLFNVLAIVPFTLALTVPLWIARVGWCDDLPAVDLTKGLHDLRATWSDPTIPAALGGAAMGVAALVAAAKWFTWIA